MALDILGEAAYVLTLVFGVLYAFDQFVIAYSGGRVLLSSPRTIYELMRRRTRRVRDYQGLRIVYGLRRTGTSFKLVVESTNRAEQARRTTIEVEGSSSVSLAHEGLDTVMNETGCKIVDDLGFIEHGETITRIYDITLSESPKSDEYQITPNIIVHENHAENKRRLSALTIKA